MDLSKLIDSLSESTKAELLAALSKIEEKKEQSFKKQRNRKPKKNAPPSCAVPQEQPQKKDRPRKAPPAGPVNRIKATNEFANSALSKQERNDTNNFDKKVKRTLIEREEQRSTKVNIACNRCNRVFSVHPMFIKHDGERQYYVCDKCIVGGSRPRG